MRSSLLIGAALGLAVGVVLGRVTARATRGWTDWQNTKALVPSARRTAFDLSWKAVRGWLIAAALIAVVVVAMTADPN